VRSLKGEEKHTKLIIGAFISVCWGIGSWTNLSYLWKFEQAKQGLKRSKRTKGN